MKPAREFDTLRLWATYSDQELENIYSPESIVLTQKLISLLGDEVMSRRMIERSSFVEVVRELRDLLRNGSRALGDALANAGELKDSGDVVQAVQVLRAFISLCPSKFYADIAKDYLKNRLGENS